LRSITFEPEFQPIYYYETLTVGSMFDNTLNPKFEGCSFYDIGGDQHNLAVDGVLVNPRASYIP
jgi:hypothetical protein